MPESRGRVEYLSPSYAISLERGLDYGALTARHYAGPSRPLLTEEGMPYAALHGCLGATLMAKLWALRALWRMFRYLRNWRDVWAAYRRAQPLPALQFRRGFVLNHGPGGRSDPPAAHGVRQIGVRRADSGRSQYLVDIGANIGSVTLDRAWSDPHVKVDATNRIR